MDCPRCGHLLILIKIGPLEVDVCQGGCGGIWFDSFELQKVDEPHETPGEALLQIERNEHLAVDLAKRIKCPRCDDMIMMRHYWSARKDIEVDECPNCGGYWLDANELTAIRKAFASEKEKELDFDKAAYNLCGGELAKGHSSQDESANQSENLARLLYRYS